MASSYGIVYTVHCVFIMCTHSLVQAAKLEHEEVVIMSGSRVCLCAYCTNGIGILATYCALL